MLDSIPFHGLSEFLEGIVGADIGTTCSGRRQESEHNISIVLCEVVLNIMRTSGRFE